MGCDVRGARCAVFATASTTLVLCLLASPGVAQNSRREAAALVVQPRPGTAAPGSVSPQGQPPEPSGTTVVFDSARDTKAALDRILTRYPPSLWQVLRLDPSLIANAAYLAPYPA